MAASKKSRRKKKTKRKRRHPRRRKQKRFEGLERKLRQGPFAAEKIVIEPPGQVKMSEVLEAFVEPYIGFADTQEDHRKLLTLAITAWNAALLPEEEQKELAGITLAVTQHPVSSLLVRSIIDTCRTEEERTMNFAHRIAHLKAEGGLRRAGPRSGIGGPETGDHPPIAINVIDHQ
jgi:hypothetical protein